MRDNSRVLRTECGTGYTGHVCEYCWKLKPSLKPRGHQKIRGKRQIRRYEAWERLQDLRKEFSL